MRIDAETVSRIQQAADIVEVVGDYVSLKKKGANLWACCPFHNEKSPSFSVAPTKGIYKCFGCGKAGDSIRFVMDVEGIGYGEALRHLAKKYSIEIAEKAPTPDEVLAQNARESLYIVLNHAKNFYQEKLFQHDEGQSIGYPYFKERGFNDATIKAFELGYSLENWDAFTKDAVAKGYSLEVLEKAGLTIRKEQEGGKEDRLYDRFRGRVIFPIHNLSGKTIAFGARILKVDKNQPKYVNSPETEVYHKSNILYGIFQAKQAIRNADVCYLVEGYTDVISLHQAGIHNVVASSGTSLTLEQIRLISRFTHNITVLYDGDAAGIKASLRGTDMILEEGLNVKVVVFPDGEDPDSFVRKVGSEAFTQHIKDYANDFITFKAELSLKEAGNDPFKRAELIKEMVESIAKIPDSIKRMVFFQKTANLMGISEDILLTESNKIHLTNQRQKQKEADRKATPNQPKTGSPADLPDGMMSFSEEDEGFMQAFIQTETEGKQEIVYTSLYYQEQEFIRLLINFGAVDIEENYPLALYMISEIQGFDFSTPKFQKILLLWREAVQNNQSLPTHFFSGNADSEVQALTIDLITEKYSLSENWAKMHGIFVPKEEEILDKLAFNNILNFKDCYINEKRPELKKQLSEAEKNGDVDLQITIMTELKRLKAIEMDISKETGNVVARSKRV